jgi:O-acetyl-ADP-ribose deacetylase (regulator of RNase III)
MNAVAKSGVIHRDLKPGNILIDFGNPYRQQARVADFGLARGPDDTDLGGWGGTPHYMAPEQATDFPNVTTRADIYSFGATFYHALTGYPPFDGKSAEVILRKHRNEPLARPKARNPALTDRVSEILERCLAKEPPVRFASFAELREQFLHPSEAPPPWEMTDDPALKNYLEHYETRRPCYLHGPPGSGECDSYTFPEGRVLKILRGDLTALDVVAVVSPENCELSMDAGASLALRNAAGEDVARTAGLFAPVPPGRVVVNPVPRGRRLKARFIFHGVTYGHVGGEWIPPSRELIAQIMKGCFDHAETLGVESIAFPLLATGAAGFSPELCLDTMFCCLSRRFFHGLTCVKEASIVIYPQKSSDQTGR